MSHHFLSAIGSFSFKISNVFKMYLLLNIFLLEIPKFMFILFNSEFYDIGLYIGTEELWKFPF